MSPWCKSFLLADESSSSIETKAYMYMYVFGEVGAVALFSTARRRMQGGVQGKRIPRINLLPHPLRAVVEAAIPTMKEGM